MDDQGFNAGASHEASVQLQSMGMASVYIFKKVSAAVMFDHCCTEKFKLHHFSASGFFLGWFFPSAKLETTCSQEAWMQAVMKGVKRSMGIPKPDCWS